MGQNAGWDADTTTAPSENPPEYGDLPDADIETRMLAFLATYRIPLKPMELYGGLVYRWDVDFSYRSVQNKLNGLLEKGYVDRVTINTDAGIVEPISDADSGRRASYLITDAGCAELDSRL